VPLFSAIGGELVERGTMACVIAGLVNDGLAAAQREVVTAPAALSTIEVVRIKTSDAGRGPLKADQAPAV
jgi:hypothetical protein